MSRHKYGPREDRNLLRSASGVDCIYGSSSRKRRNFWRYAKMKPEDEERNERMHIFRPADFASSFYKIVRESCNIRASVFELLRPRNRSSLKRTREIHIIEITAPRSSVFLFFAREENQFARWRKHPADRLMRPRSRRINNEFPFARWYDTRSDRTEFQNKVTNWSYLPVFNGS